MTHMEGRTPRPRLMATAALCLALPGCTDISNAYRGKTISLAGAGVVLDKPFEPYDEASLKALIVSAAPRATSTAPAIDAGTLPQTIGGFSRALYDPADTSDALKTQKQNQMRDARNTVQGMLLATSANRCNAFKQSLRARSTTTNFILGSLATTLGAAGAIVSGGASQALAGAASAASGVGAEYNKDIMSSVTTSVIIPGIDKQRSAVLQEILNRRCLGVSSYDLTQAMNDAIRYHAACSTDIGIAAASSALSQTKHTSSPSLAEAASTVDAIKTLHAKLVSAAAATPDDPAQESGTTPDTGATTGTTQPPAGGPADPQNPKTTTLVGDQVAYLQCPTLQADGTLAPAGVPAASAMGSTGNQIQYGQR